MLFLGVALNTKTTDWNVATLSVVCLEIIRDYASKSIFHCSTIPRS